MFKQFRIKAIGDKLCEMVDDKSYDDLTFEKEIEVFLDAELPARRDRKVAKYIKQAGLKTPSAFIEDVIYLPERTLSKDRVARYVECDWIEKCGVMVIISKIGCGKSFLCQAFGNAVCRKLIEVRYTRLAWICEEFNRARVASNGSYYENMTKLKTVPLLIIDDFVTTPVSTQNIIDLFKIMEAREHLCATLIASQLEPNE